MPDPVNYLAQLQPVAPINPLQSFTQGLGVGQSFAQQRLAAEQQRLATEQAKAKAAQQAQLGEAIARIKSPDRTIEDFDSYDLLVTGMYSPEQSKAMREVTSGMKAEEVQSALASDMQVYSALMNGEKELAAKYLRDQAKAAENAGEPDIASIVNEWATNVESGGSRADAIAGMYAHKIMVTPGGRDAMKNAIDYAKERRDAAAEPAAIEQRIADLDYTKAQTDKLRADIAKLEADSKDALLKAEANKKGAIYDPKDAAEAENALRKEFDGKQKTYQMLKASYDTITNAESTGIGDVALIFAYMKLLDPTSVVREGEVATTSTAGGVPSAIMSAYNKALGSGKIDDKVRNQIRSQAKNIFDNAGKQVESDKAFYTDIAGRRGLNVENIIYGGKPAATAATGSSGTTGVTAAPKAAQATTEVDY